MMETECVKEIRKLVKSFPSGSEFWSDDRNEGKLIDAYVEMVQIRIHEVLNRLKDGFAYTHVPTAEEVLRTARNKKRIDSLVLGMMQDVETYIKEGEFW